MDQQPPPSVQTPTPNTAPAQTPVPPPPPGNQPVQPPPPTSPTNSAPMEMPTKNRRKFLIIGIILLIVIAIGAAAYFLFMNKPAPVVKTNKPAVVQSPPTPTPDPTATWETYTNTIEGFSFKYPPGTKKNGEGAISSGKQVLGQSVEMQYNDIDLSVSVQKTLQPVKQGTESATINGVVWSLEYQPKPTNNCQGMGLGPCTSSLQYRSEQNGKLVSFYFTNTSDRQWAEQIVSTFQFVSISHPATPSINQPSASSTAQPVQ